MADGNSPTAQDADVLRQSEDGRELQRAAVLFAQDDTANAVNFLTNCLMDEGLLNRLDTPEAYQGTFNNLRLARIFSNLMENRVPPVDVLLTTLTSAPAYASNPLRIQLLIRALAVLRPAPEAAVRYWNTYAQPGGLLVFDVVEALCGNQSEPAMRLLESMFCNPGHDRYERQSWMREIMLPIRDDPPLAALSEKLVCQLLEPPLKVDMLEALFDYQPDEWYVDCEPPLPPDRINPNETVRLSLVRAGRFGLAMPDLPFALGEKIRAALESLEIRDTNV